MAVAQAATLGTADVLARLGTATGGLPADEAARRLRVVGPNAVRSYRARAWPVLRGQLRFPLLALLAPFPPQPARRWRRSSRPATG